VRRAEAACGRFGICACASARGSCGNAAANARTGRRQSNIARAFCRKTQPVWLGFALRAIGKIKRTLMPAGKSRPASLMNPG
jgi:hypothetical protein